MKRKKLLFTFQNFSSFVKTDYEILSSEFDVIKYSFRPVHGSLNALVELLKQACFLLVNIWKVDYTFTWFADFHSLLPVFFSNLAGKKSIVA